MGTWYEEFQPGTVVEHSLRRTVTEMDNVLFTSLTMNPQPLHLDEEFAKSSIYGRRIVNSLFTLGLVVSFSVTELTMGTTAGNLGYENVTFPHPVYHGDTLRAETRILQKRLSRSHGDCGIVWFEHTGFNQHDDVVCACRRAALMKRRDVGPGSV